MFFDIGANVGKWSLANISSCDKIIAVEASPLTFERLKKECNHPNITLLNYAICDNDGKDITLYHSNADTLTTINKDWLVSPTSRFCNCAPYQEFTCKTMTIDSLIETYGVPTLLKMDVEGGEYECVKSLTQKVPQLCFEWASEMNDITFKCLGHAAQLGFTEFYLQREDNYVYRPATYYDINTVKYQLDGTIPKKDWGMIWCK